MKFLLLIFLTALSLASGANEAELAGRYVLNGVREMGSALLIRSDGTFAASLAYGNVEGRVQGRWQRQGETLILQGAQGHPEIAELINDTRLTLDGACLLQGRRPGQVLMGVQLDQAAPQLVGARLAKLDLVAKVFGSRIAALFQPIRVNEQHGILSRIVKDRR